MDELERQIVAWVDAETEGVDPVTPAEAMGPRAAAGRPRHAVRRIDRGPSAIGIFAVAAAILVVIGAVALVRDQGPKEIVRSNDPTPAPTTTVPDGWRVITVGDLGWRVAAPRSWGSYGWSGGCTGSTGVVITNSPSPVAAAPPAEACRTAWDPEALRLPDMVGLAIVSGIDGEGTATTSQRIDQRQRLPITFRALAPQGDRRPGYAARSGSDVVDHRGTGAYVEAWIGEEAAPSDIAILRSMLTSITDGTDAPDASVATTAQRTDEVRTAGDGPTTRGGEVAPASGSPRMTTFIACMSDAGYHPYLADPPAGTVDGEVAATLTWPYGEQDRASYGSDHDRCNRVASESQRRRSGSTLVWPLRAGASQTLAEAKRDGVVPALAEFPLDARAVPTEWFDAPEGTWAITKMPERPDGSDCTVGEPDGVWGTERICSVEYGEVVLVDEAGRLLRAYPMPGEVPTWIYPTKDAVYAGRVGDGALPESTIVRVDRGTLEAEVLVFPTGGGLLGVDLPGWSAAPSSADIGRLVVVGDDSAGPLVASTIGMTSVDLEAVEDLFA